MEYTEIQGWADLGSLGVPFFRTGSREICSPPPMDTDADFVVLSLKKIDFQKNGFSLTTDDEYEGGSHFETYRRGDVNLVVVHNWTDFKKWKVATAAAKQMNIKSKQKRIQLFQGVLYDNW